MLINLTDAFNCIDTQIKQGGVITKVDVPDPNDVGMDINVAGLYEGCPEDFKKEVTVVMFTVGSKQYLSYISMVSNSSVSFEDQCTIIAQFISYFMTSMNDPDERLGLAKYIAHMMAQIPEVVLAN